MMTQICNSTTARRTAARPCPSDLIDPKLFRALADPARIELLRALAVQCGPRTVKEIASCRPTDVSVVSRHLAILRDAGVLSARRRGREVRYAIDCLAVADALRRLADALTACCMTRRPTPPRRMTTIRSTRRTR